MFLGETFTFADVGKKLKCGAPIYSDSDVHDNVGLKPAHYVVQGHGIATLFSPDLEKFDE